MDQVAIWGLVVSVATLVVAGIAAYFAWKAPTREDLQRLEKHTAKAANDIQHVRSHLARVDERIDEQYQHDQLSHEAQRVSIRMQGQSIDCAPLQFRFTLEDPNIVLRKLEMRHENGHLFGGSNCAADGPLTFIAEVSYDIAQSWADNRGHARLNLILVVGGKEMSREGPITVSSLYRPIPGSTGSEYCLLVNASW